MSPGSSRVRSTATLSQRSRLAGTSASPTGRTRTTAASGTDPVKLIAISCSNWQFGYFNAYKSIAQEEGIDAIVHLGDYFYEYGIDGYGAETAQELGRLHDPVTETVTLGDYRLRHAQYKTGPGPASRACVCPLDLHMGRS